MGTTFTVGVISTLESFMQTMLRVIVVCPIVLLMFLGVAVGRGTTASFSVAPTPKVVEIGASFTVTVHVSNVELMHGSSVTVRFDPNILDYEGTTWGSFYPGGGFFGYTWPSSSEATDTVVIDQALKGTAVVTGSGDIFSVQFRALKGGSTPLLLQPAVMRDIHNDDIPSTITHGLVIVNPVTVNLMALLEGPYSSGVMSTALRASGRLPLSHPYAASPWNHAGTEEVTAIPANVVDWVLIELRSGTASSTSVALRAAFLRSDAVIVDLDGTSPVAVPGIANGDFYIVLHHRTHLAAMSASAVPLTNGSALYDFTVAGSQYYGGDAVQLAPNLYGLWCGDADASGGVDALDRSATWNARNQTGYLLTDVDMSGDVTALDRSFTWNNRNIVDHVP